jgi:hypothetical protein
LVPAVKRVRAWRFVTAPCFILLGEVVHGKQSSVLLCFRRVRRRASSLTTTPTTSRMGSVPGPVAGAVVVEAEVIAIRPAFVVCTSCPVRLRPTAASSSSAVVVTARLVLLATAGTPTSILGWPGTFLLLLLVESPPLVGGVQQLAADSGGVRFWRLLSVLDRLEPPGDVLDGELLIIQQHLD